MTSLVIVILWRHCFWDSETSSTFVFQIREEILNENIYCPAEKAVLLASFAVQAKFSDFDESIHTTGNDVFQ